MKSNPFVSTSVAFGLFAVAGAITINTLTNIALAAFHSTRDSAVMVATASVTSDAAIEPDGFTEAIYARRIGLLDEDGQLRVSLAVTKVGGSIEMLSPDGRRVMTMLATDGGAFSHKIMNSGQEVYDFDSSDEFTEFAIYSPEGGSSIEARAWDDGLTTIESGVRLPAAPEYSLVHLLELSAQLNNQGALDGSALRMRMRGPDGRQQFSLERLADEVASWAYLPATNSLILKTH